MTNTNMEETGDKHEYWKIHNDFVQKNKKGKYSSGKYNYNKVLSELDESTQKWVEKHSEDEFESKLSEFSL